MCTSIVEIAHVEGEAKRGDAWFPLTHAVVAYDHARHAIADDVITIDFVNRDMEPGARAAVEITLDSAKALVAALQKAIAEAEFEEAEVRGVRPAAERSGQRRTEPRPRAIACGVSLSGGHDANGAIVPEIYQSSATLSTRSRVSGAEIPRLTVAPAPRCAALECRAGPCEDAPDRGRPGSP